MSTPDADQPAPVASKRRHLIRLGLLAVALATLWGVVAGSDLIDAAAIRSSVQSAGALAPLAYIAMSTALGAIFVPGPILAAGSGLLFGPYLGTAVTLCSAVGTSVVTSLVGRRAGRNSARELLGQGRAEWVDDQIQRRGLWAVVGQRFIPGMSDALAAYGFGALGVPTWQMALGAFIGSAPRAFVYTAVGASLANPSAPLIVGAVVVWCITAIVGAAAARRGLRSWRAHRRRSTDVEAPAS